MQYKEFLSIYDINYIKFKDGGKNKMKLDKFIGMMTGHFDNKEQFDIMQRAGKIYPYAEHINTICNDKIKTFLRILTENLLLKKVIMKPMENAMHHPTFSLLWKLRTELFFLHMKFQQEKTRIHFHIIL